MFPLTAQIIQQNNWSLISKKSWRSDLTPIGRAARGLRELLSSHLVKQVNENRLPILEIGSELGGSTRVFLEHFPDRDVVCIDPWMEGYRRPEEWARYEEFTQVDNHSLFRLFLTFHYQYRRRILPIRMYSRDALPFIRNIGIEPALIYVDGDHRYLGVLSDLIACHCLFPNAILIGDDWNFSSKYKVYKGIDKPVRQAVVDFAEHYGFGVMPEANSWILWKSTDNDEGVLDYMTRKSK